MIVIGIAGGIASGKSFVAEQFKQLGAVVLDADRAGHRVLLEKDIKDQIRETFGDAVFDEEGEIARERLGGIVFHSDDAPARLKQLEQITHPRIRELLDRQIADLQSSSGLRQPATNQPQPVQAAVLDAPVMFKSGWKDFCDAIVFVDVPVETRRERAVKRGWVHDELDRREALQTPLPQKRALSDFVINNNQSPEETRIKVLQIWNQLVIQNDPQTNK